MPSRFHDQNANRQWATLSFRLIGGGGVLLCFYITSLLSYLLFHTLIELVTIGIAWGVLMIVWNTCRFIENTYIKIIAVGYAFIASLDLLHTVLYKGMNLLPGYDANLPTQLWIGARYLQSLTLLLAPLLLRRKLSLSQIAGVYSVVVSGFLLTLFVWPIFPTCFVEGVGLTPFKIGSEFLICALLVVALILFARQRSAFERVVFRWLLFSLLTTIVSELAFTFYVSVYGVSNLVGHYFKLFTFYSVYKAVIETGLRQPFSLLFRDLKTRETALEESEARFRQMFNQHSAMMLVIDPDNGKIMMANQAARQFYGYSPEAFEHLTVYQLNLLNRDKIDRNMHHVRTTQRSYFNCRHRLANGTICDVEVHSTPISLQDHTFLFSIVHDITDDKQAKAALQESEARLHFLISASPAIIYTCRASGNYGTTFVSPNILDTFGFRPEEFIRDANFWTRHIHPEDVERVLTELSAR